MNHLILHHFHSFDLKKVSLSSTTLHFFSPVLAPFGIDVTIPSVALGMHLTVVDLQNDGCERVSREEEAVLRVCQAVNR